ncbi:MAG TPA: hypothetical protein VJ742_00060 [Nitrososphaera sp.]|nr:hypothetical protein [Nitrososphaera sp.]
MMFHCPACDGQVVEHKTSNLIRQVMEWKCTVCSKKYGVEELKKAILRT